MTEAQDIAEKPLAEVVGHQSFPGDLTSQFDRAAEQLRASFIASSDAGGGRWHLILTRDAHLTGSDK